MCTRRALRGVTLVELMVALAMVAVLGALAIVGYYRWKNHAEVAETKDLIQAISYGQENYYAKTQGYLNCSGMNWDNNSIYPLAVAPSDMKRNFHTAATSRADWACWRVLAPDAGHTYMGFWTSAGTSMQTFPTIDMAFTNFVSTYPRHSDKPWYAAGAVGDPDGDMVYSFFYVNSYAPNDIHVENPYE